MIEISVVVEDIPDSEMDGFEDKLKEILKEKFPDYSFNLEELDREESEDEE